MSMCVLFRKSVIFALLTAAPVGFNCGGTYPGTSGGVKQVLYTDLVRYYAVATNGLIRPSAIARDAAYIPTKFTWDPYFKKRIRSISGLRITEMQDLFELDQAGMVKAYGDKDLISAIYEFYSRQSFDEKKQTFDRPYRYLNAWGSLAYPPIKSLTHPLPFYHSRFADGFNLKSVSSPYFDPEFQKQLDDETGTELTYGNHLHALFNGENSYPEKVRFTRQAKKLLYVAVMTLVADSTGRELVRNMVNLRRSGVDVRVITEGFYAFSISNYSMGILERAGIPIVFVDDKSLSQLNRMFHNKLWICDGEEAILGGMNVLSYENNSNGFNFLNRDTDILIRGPAVTSLLESFIDLWKKYDTDLRPISLGEYILANNLAAERDAGVRGRENYDRWFSDPDSRMNGICRTAVQGNNAEPQKIVMLLLRYLEAAQHSFYMSSPEVEFDPKNRLYYHDMLARLMLKKASNPDFYAAYITNGYDGGKGEKSIFLRAAIHDANRVGDHYWEDMLTPLIDEDGREVNRFVRKTIAPLIQGGVHGFQYFNYMHAKQFYFDRLLVGIGSWNFDNFSANNNHECAIFCLDDSLRRQMEVQLVLDMVNSVPIIEGALPVGSKKQAENSKQ